MSRKKFGRSPSFTDWRLHQPFCDCESHSSVLHLLRQCNGTFFVIVGKIHGHHTSHLLPFGEESIAFTLRVVDNPRLGPLLGFPGLVRSGVLPPLRFSFLVQLAHSLLWASLRIEWMASTQKCLAQLHGSSLRPLSGRDPHACNPLWLDKPTPFYETVPMCLGGGNPWLDTSFDPGACCPR